MSNSPRFSNKKPFKIFSRQSKDKDKDKRVRSLPAEIPHPWHALPQPRTPHRSFTSPYRVVDRNVSLNLRVDVQRAKLGFPYRAMLEKFPTPTMSAPSSLPSARSLHDVQQAKLDSPYTAMLEKFPTPTMIAPGSLPSPRSLHDLRVKENESVPPIVYGRPRGLSRPRPKGFVGEPEASWMYHRDNQSTSALEVFPVTQNQNEGSPIASPVPSLLSDSDGDSVEPESPVDLDEYPWYFVEIAGDAERIHGLTRLTFPRAEESDKLYMG